MRKALVAIATITLAMSCNPQNPRPPVVMPTLVIGPPPVVFPRFAFTVKDGRIENRFLRERSVAAHVLATSGDAPRVVFAFPAGNMGVGLWFEGTADIAFDDELTVAGNEPMVGVSATFRAHTPALRVKKAILGSIRALRDYGHDGRVPAGLDHEEDIVGGELGSTARLRRTTLDGGHHLEIAIAALDGTVPHDEHDVLSFTAPPNGEVRLVMTALSDEPPLTALPTSAILNAHAADDKHARDALTFLTYEEKICAGSWQYLTYFGRDTLLSTRLLMPVLQPAVVEAALGAVIERLDPTGDVAHEEDVGEWAVMENAKHGLGPVRTPRYDYKMVDDDFLLAPVLAAYVESDAGRPRAAAFFAKKTSSGKTYAEAVRTNLDRVVRLAGAAPLVRIREDLPVGNWRDSEEGLGNGKYPYDVNAALVPAALRATANLAPFVGGGDGANRAALELAKKWDDAGKRFEVTIDVGEAKKRVAAYAADQKIDARDALASIDGPVVFPGVSLDGNQKPVPIMNSDDGFVMMFGEPSSAWLVASAKRITRPFPAGLRTPVGIVVANAAYATDPKLRAIFTRDHYHGAVVWSWQQAMLLAGVRRQRARTDLDDAAKRALEGAEDTLTKVIDATRANRTSELWSWTVENGAWRVVPFGQSAGHHTEANAVQLWSTVYLALDGTK
ncbi:MAG TPA: hypothetical protein VIF62_03605 [Labilithrix sp.]